MQRDVYLTATDFVNSIRNASDFVDLCALYGYYAEEHVVQTTDGYLLGIHRLGWRKSENGLRVNSGPGSLKKSVVYLHHGAYSRSWQSDEADVSERSPHEQ